MNKEKLTAILTKLSNILGLESEDKIQELATTPEEDEEEKEQEQTEPKAEAETEPEAESEPKTDEEEEEEKVEATGEPEDVAQLTERLNQLTETITSILAEVEALKQSKAQTEEENTQLKEKLSAVETKPADSKINLNAQTNTTELTPAQRHLQILRSMK